MPPWIVSSATAAQEEASVEFEIRKAAATTQTAHADGRRSGYAALNES
jgi:hypothetical protein